MGGGGSYSTAEMQSVYSTVPADKANGHSLEEVLALCRDAVGVFYSISQLSHRTLVRVVFLLLCRDAIGVFYSPSQLSHRTLVRVVFLLLCRDAIGVFYRPSQLSHRTLVRVVFLLLCRDAIGVFYSPSQLSHRTLVGVFFFYSSAEMQSLYSTAPTNWVIQNISLILRSV